MPRWRLVHTLPLGGAMNMAVDVALMERARRTGEAVFRVYTWAAPTLSFGRNQTAVGRYALERIRERALDVVRRPTGGRAILHWREVTYSVTAPATDAVGLRQSYERINRILFEGLRRVGVAVEVAGVSPESRASRPSATPCFAEPSVGEMTAEGRKLVGSAQWRDAGALLQHGSILIDDDQSTLASLMVDPPPPIPRPGTLADVLGRTPSVDEIADAMFSAVRHLETPEASFLDVDEVLRDADVTLKHFLDHEWTWRR